MHDASEFGMIEVQWIGQFFLDDIQHAQHSISIGITKQIGMHSGRFTCVNGIVPVVGCLFDRGDQFTDKRWLKQRSEPNRSTDTKTNATVDREGNRTERTHFDPQCEQAGPTGGP